MSSRREFARWVGTAVGAPVAIGLSGCTAGEYDVPAWFTDRGNQQLTASVDGDLTLPLEERWSQSIGSEITGSPVGGHENVLVGTVDGELHALDPSDGTTAWSYDAGVAIDSAPTAVSENGEQYIWVTARNGEIHSVDPSDGSWRWSEPGGSGTFHSATNYSGLLVFQTYLENGTTSTLRAIGAENGYPAWKEPLGNVTTATPLLGSGTVHEGIAQGGKVYRAFEADTGTGEWDVTTSTTNARSFTSGVLDTDVPQGDPNRIYLSTEDGYVSGHAANTGAQLWREQLPNFGIVHGFALTQERSSNTLVVAQRGAMYGFDPATGTRQWTYSHARNPVHPRTRRTARPAIYGDYVFQVVGGSKLVAVSLSNGTEEWSASLSGSSTHSSPLVGGETVYVGDSSGTLYAFSP